MKTKQTNTCGAKNSPSWQQLAVTSAMALALTSLAACGGGGSSGSGSGSSGGTVADISGSGFVQGSIDGFGSVIVNGVHYNTDDAEFLVRDVNGQQTDLKVGQLVTIVGSRDGSEGVAQSVTYEASIEGPVISIDRANKELEVLGQIVAVDGMTVFDGVDFATLAAGDFIEVSGIRSSNGLIVAGFIELEVDQGVVELHGEISQLNAGNRTFKIQSQRIDYNAAQLDTGGKDLANGMHVEVEGELVAGVLVATEVENEDLEIDEGTEVDIEGLISDLDIAAKLFSVEGLSVSYDSNTEFDDGSILDLAIDKLVEVEGVIDDNGVLQAESIEFEEVTAAEVSAVVEQVDSVAGTVTLLGVTIAVDSDTRIEDERDELATFSLSDIVVGDYLELLVSRDGQGVLKALKLARDDNETEVLLQAELGSVDSVAKNINLLGKNFDLTAAGISFYIGSNNEPTVTINDFFNALQVGQTITLLGTAGGGPLIISEAIIVMDD